MTFVMSQKDQIRSQFVLEFYDAFDDFLTRILFICNKYQSFFLDLDVCDFTKKSNSVLICSGILLCI
jgi:hypothetical protein